MLNLNPHLHTKILDCLLLHMRNGHWEAMATDLLSIGVAKTQADALLSWASDRSSGARGKPAMMRMLHPMEREFLSSDAYSYLLDLQHLGLLDYHQLEQIIESCAMHTSLPVSRSQLIQVTLKLLGEQIDAQCVGQSH